VNRQPNILLICADQLGARHVNTYSSGVNSTPNLDRLAARGAGKPIDFN